MNAIQTEIVAKFMVEVQDAAVNAGIVFDPGFTIPLLVSDGRGHYDRIFVTSKEDEIEGWYLNLDRVDS